MTPPETGIAQSLLMSAAIQVPCACAAVLGCPWLSPIRAWFFGITVGFVLNMVVIRIRS